MLVPRRVKATALVTALGVHAGLFTAVLSYVPGPVTQSADIGAIRVSIRGSGQIPVDTTIEDSVIREVATVASTGINPVSTVTAKGSSEAIATTISVATAQVVEAGPATGSFIQTLLPDTATDNSLTVEDVRMSLAQPAMDPTVIDTLKSVEGVATEPSVEVPPPPAFLTPHLSASTADGNPPELVETVDSTNPVMTEGQPRTPPTKVSRPSDAVSTLSTRKSVSRLPSPATSESVAGDTLTRQKPVATSVATSIPASQEVQGVLEKLTQLIPANPTRKGVPSVTTTDDTNQPATSVIGPQVETGDIAAAQRGYLNILYRHLMRFKRYPRAARRNGVTGVVTIRLTILANGSLNSPQLIVSSGDDRLDQAALKMLARARPLPPFPANLHKAQLELNLPIKFALTQKHGLF